MIITVAPELDSVFRQCGYSPSHLNEFLGLLDKYPLGVDWASLWRQVVFPSQPRSRDLEPFIYYYVPGSGFGNPSSSSDFIRSAVGLGLTFGCPVRLYHALRIVDKLPPQAQHDCLAALKNPPAHLPTVEELLWPHGFSLTGPVARGAKTIDWAIPTEIGTIHLEVKYKPADWARVADSGFVHNTWVRNAARQLGARAPGSFNVVGITTFDVADPQTIAQIENDLNRYSNIDAVIIKPMLAGFLVCSLSAPVTAKLISVLRPIVARFPKQYSFLFDWRERDARVSSRGPTRALRPFASEWSVLHTNGEVRQIGGISAGTVEEPAIMMDRQMPSFRATITYDQGEPRLTPIPKFPSEQRK